MLQRHICLLEDSPDIMDVLKIIFEAEGYKISAFSTVEEFDLGTPALTPDLFILDVMVPDGSGLEVCERLKTDARTLGIPVLIMTANMGIDQMRKTSKANQFMQKPFDVQALVSSVSNLINHA
ncbi:MAG: response regulator [Pedobacter sp.]|nr:MAG: response regulator [Pedobacter sp.]